MYMHAWLISDRVLTLVVQWESAMLFTPKVYCGNLWCVVATKLRHFLQQVQINKSDTDSNCGKVMQRR